MKTRLCPKCAVGMQTTHEPYELRCPDCGFWFDTYTGKPISVTGQSPEVIEHGGSDYFMTGHRIGQTVQMCYEPRMTVLLIGYDPETRHWLGRYIEPAGMDTLTVLTEDFLDYEENH